MFGLIHKDAILGAAHDLKASECMSRWEELGWRCPREWEDTLALVEPPDDVEAAYHVGEMIGRVSQSWGFDVGLVFHHAGIVEVDRQRSAIFWMIMGCTGAGSDLEDHFGEEIEQAETTLHCAFPPSPIYTEFNVAREWAESQFPDDSQIPDGLEVIR